VKVLIIGAGLGGLTAALSLRQAGLEVDVFEQAQDVGELGVGINLLPHGTKVLAALGLLPDLDEAGIRTRELIYTNRFGQVVWRELRGTDAGYDAPQFSIHRGKLYGILHRAVLSGLGRSRLHVGCRLTTFEQRGDHVAAQFIRGADGQRMNATGDALIGCDGIHSAVRAALYPGEQPPVWNGVTVWRGATNWPRLVDGRTMVVAGGIGAKFVFYPIHARASAPRTPLTNWAVMARLGNGGDPPPRREDWSRAGSLYEALAFTQHRFSLPFVDPVAMIESTRTFLEFPLCDRDPLPRWSFDSVTLLGDAAHPMSPVGSNGAAQAILDATALARCLAGEGSVAEALRRYENERRPPTTKLISSNRQGGPERVIDLVEARAPSGFQNLDAVATYAERQAIVRAYDALAQPTAARPQLLQAETN
jgi:5-methylphenazine-1-carboxylate 1-monooxygenase